jgi:predicted nucleic-acid-binding protein
MMLLDTNILIRYLTNDDPSRSSRCEWLLKEIAEGKKTACLNHMVLAEVIWVLISKYKIPKDQIAELILRILETPGMDVPDKDILITAFGLWREADFKVDYLDAYNAAWVICHKLKGIYSYDRDFESLRISRVEP